jgi:non-specific serine/threonine protein kinase
VLHNLGYVSLRRGDPGRARACFAEAIPIFRRMDDRRGLAECVTGLACVLAAQGEAERAATLFGATERAFETLETAPPPHNRADSDLGVAAARASMDDGAFAASWSHGHTMSLEQAIAYALEEPPSA